MYFSNVTKFNKFKLCMVEFRQYEGTWLNYMVALHILTICSLCLGLPCPKSILNPIETPDSTNYH